MMRKNTMNELAQKMDTIIGMIGQMDARITELEQTKEASAKKTTTKATKSTKATSTKKATPKTEPKNDTKSTTKKSSAKKTAPKSTSKTKGVDIMDFEPCKFKGTDNYVWNGVRGYKAMRSAYCYAKQTDGKAKNLADARKIGATIDFEKAWNKDKAEFEKKFHYVKAADRQ